MKKRIKVFEPGKYPQGDYPTERVKKIFGSVKDKIKTRLSLIKLDSETYYDSLR